MRSVVLGLLIGAGAAAGCAQSRDDRDPDLDYMTQAIFAPSCGLTQCHSTFRQQEGLVFDTPEGVRTALLGYGWLQFDWEGSDQYYPYASNLYGLLAYTELFASEFDTPRMPLDAPLLNKDLELIVTWIKDPSVPQHGEVGFGKRAIGAQCDPERNLGSYACDRDKVVVCGDDWNFGEVVFECLAGCNADCKVDQCPIPGCTPTEMPPNDCLEDCLPLHCSPQGLCKTP